MFGTAQRALDMAHQIDRRLGQHEAECTLLRSQMGEFMTDAKKLFSRIVWAVISGAVGIVVWALAQVVHVHIG